MGHSIQEYKFIESLTKIIILNRFDVCAAHEDAERYFNREIGINYVKNAIDKMKRRGNRKTAEASADSMAALLIQTHESLMAHQYHMLHVLHNKEVSLVSTCCHMPVLKETRHEVSKYYCMKCHIGTRPIEIINETVIEMKRGLLKDIREDMESITKLILDIRDGKTYRGLSDFPPPNQNLQQVNVYRDKESVLTADERKALEMAKYLPPQDREKIIKKIENIILDEKLKELEEEGILPPEDEK